jgi:hypothetical protein
MVAKGFFYQPIGRPIPERPAPNGVVEHSAILATPK